MHGPPNFSRCHVQPTRSVKKWMEDQCQPHQKNRVYYQRYMNNVHQAFQSLIVAGKLKRMELITINNRAVFNRGKVQRCEWLTKKYPLGASQFLPDLKSISINNCSFQKEANQSKQEKRYQITQVRQDPDEKIMDYSIDEAATKKRFILHANRTQDYTIDPCNASREKQEQNRKITKFNSIEGPAQRSRINFLKFRKAYRRSATQAVYHQQLKELQRKQSIVNRHRGKSLQRFLRRIKFFSNGHC